MDQTINVDNEAVVEPTVEAVHIAEEHTEEAAQTINETMAENIVEEIAEPAIEVVSENVVFTAEEPIIEVITENIVEAAQATATINVPLNSEHIVTDNFVQDNVGKDSADSDDTKSDDKAESSASQRISTQHNLKVNDIGGSTQRDTEAHFQDMYYANWSNHDCIFTSQRAADFVKKCASTIVNPELLANFQAIIVQVKSLHNRFDETQKEVIGLRNDVTARELTLKHEKISLSREQDAMKTRLSKIEENQTVMSAKIDSIAASLELLTSVLIPDDVKKGERVLKDKCKRSQTLST